MIAFCIGKKTPSIVFRPLGQASFRTIIPDIYQIRTSSFITGFRDTAKGMAEQLPLAMTNQILFMCE